jgi:hypothetical protein
MHIPRFMYFKIMTSLNENQLSFANKILFSHTVRTIRKNTKINERAVLTHNSIYKMLCRRFVSTF